MVYYFFDTKSRLFAAAMAFPVNPADSLASLLQEGLDDLGSRLVRYFLQVWDEAGSFEPLFALMRSAPTDEQSAALLQEFLRREVVARLHRVTGTADASLRAELVGSHLMGLALARYVVRIEPLASASPETIARWVGPGLQRYVEAPSPGR